MAITRCPACNTRVSSRARNCPACGTPIAEADKNEKLRAGRHLAKHKIIRLKVHLLVAMTIFVAGAGWLFLQPFAASGKTNVPAIVVSVVGAIWYTGARLAIWQTRNK